MCGPLGPRTGSSSGMLPGSSCGIDGSPGSRIGGGTSGRGLPGGSSCGGSFGCPGVAGGFPGGSIGIVDNGAGAVRFHATTELTGASHQKRIAARLAGLDITTRAHVGDAVVQPFVL